jgi:hypothetical protein
MMSIIKEILDRLVAMEKQALASLTNSAIDSVNYGAYSQEAFPYWYNRLGGKTYSQSETGMEIISNVITINARLVIAHATAGYRGEYDDVLYDYIDAFEDYFWGHGMLTSTDYPNGFGRLRDEARLVSNAGSLLFTNSGVEGLQLGTEFVIELNIIK